MKQICINSGRRPEEPGRGRAFRIHWYAPRGPQSLTCSSLVASEKINCHFLPVGRWTKLWPGGKAFPCMDQECAEQFQRANPQILLAGSWIFTC